MDLTVFLAQLWGPVLLAVGIGLYASRPYYTKIYRDLEKEPLAVLMFAMIGMAAGILQVGGRIIPGTPSPRASLAFLAGGSS